MKRAFLWDYFLIAESFTRLLAVQPGNKLVHAQQFWQQAAVYLDHLLTSQHMPQLEESRLAGFNLLNRLKSLLQLPNAGEEVVSQEQFNSIQADFFQFQIILRNELSALPVYFVTEKALYSVKKLIAAAEDAFVPETKKRLSPFAIEEIQSAGKCLAFELPTAAGFHALRAVEAIVVDYLKQLNVSSSKRDWGEYIKLLGENEANPNATAVLDQLRKLHRNPLMHPEATLTINQAIDVFQLCRSAISALIDDMESRKLFP